MRGVEVEQVDDEGDARLGGELRQILTQALNSAARLRLFDEGQMSGEWSARMAYWGMGRSSCA